MQFVASIKTYENLLSLKSRVSELTITLSSAPGVLTGDKIKSGLGDMYRIFELFLEELTPDEKTDLSKVLSRFQLELSKIEVIELEVAFNPDANFKNTISGWIQDNVGSNVVVRFIKNPHILSGSVLTFRGKYGDFTSNKKLINLFKDRKEFSV